MVIQRISTHLEYITITTHPGYIRIFTLYICFLLSEIALSFILTEVHRLLLWRCLRNADCDDFLPIQLHFLHKPGERAQVTAYLLAIVKQIHQLLMPFINVRYASYLSSIGYAKDEDTTRRIGKRAIGATQFLGREPPLGQLKFQFKTLSPLLAVPIQALYLLY